MIEQISFSSGNVRLYPNSSALQLSTICGNDYIVITDENVARYHHQLLPPNTIIIPAGEQTKQPEIVKHITEQLLLKGATRHTTIVGVGGGVLTDIVGFVGATYMRGIKFGFVPTTLLGLVDASIGGKNGVDVGVYKNIMGTIRQPTFILHHYALLSTLPQSEWVNGFAEVIKYAALFDPQLFALLQQSNIHQFQSNATILSSLVNTCMQWKLNLVQQDEWETGPRKLLNFGHTLGHAIENTYHLTHGQAVAIGMVLAAQLSVIHSSLPQPQATQLTQLIAAYQLPTSMHIAKDQIANTLLADKKRNGDTIDFILLNNIGKPIIKPLSIQDILNIIPNPPL